MTQAYYLAIISHLAEQIYGQPIFLDADTGQLLRYDREQDTYYPIMTTDSAPAPIWHFDPSRLISASQLLRSENFGNFQTDFSNFSEQFQTHTRNDFRKDSEKNQQIGQQHSEKNQSNYSSKSDQRRQQLFRFYSIADFHQLYNEPIRSIAYQIEQLTFQLLSNTTKRQTVDKILELYRRAQKQAEQGDEYHLRQSLEKLQGKRQQQINMQQVRQRQQRRQRFWRTVKIISLTLVLTIVFGWKVFTGIKRNIKHSSTPPTSQTSKITAQNTSDGYTFDRSSRSDDYTSFDRSSRSDDYTSFDRSSRSDGYKVYYYLIIGSYRNKAVAQNIAESITRSGTLHAVCSFQALPESSVRNALRGPTITHRSTAPAGPTIIRSTAPAGQTIIRSTAPAGQTVTKAIIINSNGLYRIAIARYSTLSQARKGYLKLKKQVPDVWILKQ